MTRIFNFFNTFFLNLEIFKIVFLVLNRTEFRIKKKIDKKRKKKREKLFSDLTKLILNIYNNV